MTAPVFHAENDDPRRKSAGIIWTNVSSLRLWRHFACGAGAGRSPWPVVVGGVGAGALRSTAGAALVDAVVAELLSYFSGSRASEQSFEEFEARYIAGRIDAALACDPPARGFRAAKAGPQSDKFDLGDGPNPRRGSRGIQL